MLTQQTVKACISVSIETTLQPCRRLEEQEPLACAVMGASDCMGLLGTFWLGTKHR